MFIVSISQGVKNTHSQTVFYYDLYLKGSEPLPHSFAPKPPCATWVDDLRFPFHRNPYEGDKEQFHRDISITRLSARIVIIPWFSLDGHYLIKASSEQRLIKWLVEFGISTKLVHNNEIFAYVQQVDHVILSRVGEASRIRTLLLAKISEVFWTWFAIIGLE